MLEVKDRISSVFSFSFFQLKTNMAFGPKGRPSSAGKPRIPGDAIILFEVEMVSLPGRETELIDLIGDE